MPAEQVSSGSQTGARAENSSARERGTTLGAQPHGQGESVVLESSSVFVAELLHSLKNAG